jgi:hypothetical protein
VGCYVTKGIFESGFAPLQRQSVTSRSVFSQMFDDNRRMAEGNTFEI